MVIKKIWDYQNRLEEIGKKFVEKNMKHLRMFPKIIIFFSITYWHSLFISCQLDLYMWLFVTLSFGLFIFIFPFSKFIKLDNNQ